MVMKLSGSSARDGQTEANDVSMSAATGPLTAEERAELERLAAMPDEDIDYSDIPPVSDFTGWQRGRFYRSPGPDAGPRPVTLQLDPATLAWFQRHPAADGGMEAAMAAVLRRHAAEAE